VTNRDEKMAEVIELIKIWFFIRNGNLLWSGVLAILEERINGLCEELGQ